MKVTITLDTTNNAANVLIHDQATGTFVSGNNLKLGATGHMTVDQVDKHARELTKQALHKTAAAL